MQLLALRACTLTCWCHGAHWYACTFSQPRIRDEASVVRVLDFLVCSMIRPDCWLTPSECELLLPKLKLGIQPLLRLHHTNGTIVDLCCQLAKWLPM